MPKVKKPVVRKLIDAFGYSLSGLKSAYKSETAFQLEILAAVILIPAALLMNITATATAILVGSILLILIVEMINTAIESLADKISSKNDKLIGKAKDTGSAAVFLTIINAIACWAIIVFL